MVIHSSGRAVVYEQISPVSFEVTKKETFPSLIVQYSGRLYTV